MLTVEEAAEELRLTKWAVLKRIERGQLKARKKAGVWDIDRRSFNAAKAKERKSGGAEQ
jgi:hypothetical protein